MKLDRRRLGSRRWCRLKRGDWVWTLGANPKIGKLKRVNGAYHYVKMYDGKARYESEWYRIELAKATDEEVMLWMLEN